MTKQLESGFLLACDLLDPEMRVRLVGLSVFLCVCVHLCLNVSFQLCMCVYGSESVRVCGSVFV